MFSKKTTYAIRAMIFVAANASENSKMGGKEIAEKLEIPASFLAKILQELSKHDILSSVKGPKGGFFLSQENLETPLAKIMEAFDDQDFFENCVFGLKECASDNPCPVHHIVASFKLDMLNQLKYQTIGEIAKSISEGKMGI